MKTLHFSTEIEATPEKVWKNLWDKSTYTEWTQPFCEGSYYEAKEWKEGGRVHFLAPNGSGMYSDIEKLDENKYASFKHLGELKDGKELPLDEKSKLWSGSHENYKLVTHGSLTEVQIELQVPEAESHYMEEAWPKALELLKRISEGRA
ncbi:MAG: SRPBCC domain-containing protein [Bacteroidota bacterium]